MTTRGSHVATRKLVEVEAAESRRLLLTVEDAARLLSIGRPKMWQLIMAGEVLSVKIGTSRRIPTTSLDVYVQRLTEDAAGLIVRRISA
ncbi:MAG TPA: helix-turn-helix domain-containing protein [Ktedonobacterales bacterium]|nr:helix-turn-helix domain-containing protein [Ktedonobacterales bacterium]